MAAVTPTKADLAAGFFKLGATAFGGAGPMMRHVLVEERGWLDDRGFAELVGLCQALPGANTCNMAVMIGDRFHGAVGALLALVALMAAPLGGVVVLASVYAEIAANAEARWAISGAAAAAAGLMIGAAVKTGQAFKDDRLALGLIAGAFAAVGVARLSLPWALTILAPASLATVLWREPR